MYASDVSKMFVSIFATSLSIYGIKFFNIPFASTSTCLAKWFTVLFITLEGAAYIVLIVLYAIALYNFNLIDKDMLNYARDNSCSDAVLQRSIDVFANSFNHDRMLTSLGLFFVLLSFFSYVLIILYSNCKPCLAKYCKIS